LEQATAIFRSLPPREQASILRPRAENPRLSAERRAEARRPWLAKVLEGLRRR
jgi:hypothetical protein